MSVRIFSVEPKSLCDKKRIKTGDTLVSINGNEIGDVLDYKFYASEQKLSMVIKKPKGKIKTVKITKGEYEDLGLGFETFLMDNQRHCSNKCIFCFIDQLPKGLRESLYFKDDDARLSFLFGNYITLTNLEDKDVERIIKMHISPVNISVHTMNPDLRVKMMNNPKAGSSLKHIERFAKAGIKINTQLVLCPGINDGDELEYSLNELAKFYPSIKSISAVPVGLSRYREEMFELNSYTKEQAEEVINIIEKFNHRFMCYNNEIIAFAGDEFFLIAGRDIPNVDYYNGFPQLENGVGLWASFKHDFESALMSSESENLNADKIRKITIVTGEAAYPLISELVDETTKKWHNLRINTIKIKNKFLGDKITVAGLLTGKDIIEGLSNVDLGDELLIPRVSLRHEGDMFLDDVTVEQMAKVLGVRVVPVSNDGEDFLNALLGKK